MLWDFLPWLLEEVNSDYGDGFVSHHINCYFLVCIAQPLLRCLHVLQRVTEVQSLQCSEYCKAEIAWNCCHTDGWNDTGHPEKYCYKYALLVLNWHSESSTIYQFHLCPEVPSTKSHSGGPAVSFFQAQVSSWQVNVVHEYLNASV